MDTNLRDTRDKIKNEIRELKDKLTQLREVGNFPNDLKETTLLQIDALINNLKARNNWITPAGITEIEKTRELIKNISENNLQNKFRPTYNQICILFVSQLETSLENIFSEIIDDYPDWITEGKNSKIDFSEIVKVISGETSFSSLVLNKLTGISFQDMRAINRSFKDIAGIDIEGSIDDRDRNTIVFYQQIRHSIAHNGSVIDEKMLRSLNVLEANVKGFKSGDIIEIHPADLDSMLDSFTKLAECILAKFCEREDEYNLLKT